MGAVGWRQFRDEHPDARVLARSTGHDRDYLANPYVGYDDPDSEPLFALPTDPDTRLPVKARVVGVGRGDDAVAVPGTCSPDRASSTSTWVGSASCSGTLRARSRRSTLS